jgi:integrase/recombinase XerD
MASPPDWPSLGFGLMGIMLGMSNIIPHEAPSHWAHDASSAEMVQSYILTLQSDKSRVTTLESLRRIARLFGVQDELSVPWARLTYDQMSQIRLALAAHYAPASANLTLSALRQLLKIGFVLGHVDARTRDAAHEVKSIKGSRLPRGRALSYDEQEKMLVYLRALPKYRGTMLASAMLVSIGGGLRREELCRLAVGADIGYALRVLGKGNKERAVVLDVDTRAALDAWLPVRERLSVEHQALFCCPQRPDWPLTCATWWSEVRQAADACGVQFSGPHDFRRTCATRLLEAGLDLFEVQEVLGHSDPSTTKKYDHRSVDALTKKRAEMRILVNGMETPSTPTTPPAPSESIPEAS